MMKITFFLNTMGVYSNKWYADNNIPYTELISFNRVLNKEITTKKWLTKYCCGRIDIHGTGEPYGMEYSIGVMEEESWGKLGFWLSRLELDYIPPKDMLLDMFEKGAGHNIKWFDKGCV